jgi:hypothetical protein
MKRWVYVMFSGLLAIAFGCSTARTPVALDPVGPSQPERQAQTATGYLRVYSATAPSYDGVYYFPHTDYRIYSVEKAFFQQVRNASAMTDEEPALVRLPAGRYIVEALSESYGLVTVPVVIKDARTTVLRLEHRWSKAAGLPNDDATHVCLPNGQIVGTRAAVN